MQSDNISENHSKRGILSGGFRLAGMRRPVNDEDIRLHIRVLAYRAHLRLVVVHARYEPQPSPCVYRDPNHPGAQAQSKAS